MRKKAPADTTAESVAPEHRAVPSRKPAARDVRPPLSPAVVALLRKSGPAPLEDLPFYALVSMGV